jgi:hypothetical protein
MEIQEVLAPKWEVGHNNLFLHYSKLFTYPGRFVLLPLQLLQLGLISRYLINPSGKYVEIFLFRHPSLHIRLAVQVSVVYIWSLTMMVADRIVNRLIGSGWQCLYLPWKGVLLNQSVLLQKFLCYALGSSFGVLPESNISLHLL